MLGLPEKNPGGLSSAAPKSLPAGLAPLRTGTGSAPSREQAHLSFPSHAPCSSPSPTPCSCGEVLGLRQENTSMAGTLRKKRKSHSEKHSHRLLVTVIHN